LTNYLITRHWWKFGRGVGDILSGSKQNDVAKTTAAATTEDAVRATHPPPILPIDVDNDKVGVIITTSDHDTITAKEGGGRW
jgi:hypothetical protein